MGLILWQALYWAFPPLIAGILLCEKQGPAQVGAHLRRLAGCCAGPRAPLRPCLGPHCGQGIACRRLAADAALTARPEAQACGQNVSCFPSLVFNCELVECNGRSGAGLQWFKSSSYSFLATRSRASQLAAPFCNKGWRGGAGPRSAVCGSGALVP